MYKFAELGKLDKVSGTAYGTYARSQNKTGWANFKLRICW